MEQSLKKYWILALAIPITIVGLFVAYLIVSYAQKTVTSETAVSSPSYDYGVDSSSGEKTNDIVIGSSAAGTNVIKTGYVSVAAEDMDSTLTSIQSLDDKYNAELTSLQDTGKDNDRMIYLTIKVEESSFNDLYNEIKVLPGEFLYSSIGSTDVTETVEDLQIQLDSLQAQKTQLDKIMDKATTVTDILAVQEQLTSVEAQIESLKAEIKSYDNQTSYSYITVYITQSTTGYSITGDEWLPLGILKEAAQALLGFVKFLGTGLIWILVFSPVIAAVVVPIVLIQKRAKK